MRKEAEVKARVCGDCYYLPHIRKSGRGRCTAPLPLWARRLAPLLRIWEKHVDVNENEAADTCHCFRERAKPKFANVEHRPRHIVRETK
jgi:hypothetical protein